MKKILILLAVLTLVMSANVSAQYIDVQIHEYNLPGDYFESDTDDMSRGSTEILYYHFYLMADGTAYCNYELTAGVIGYGGTGFDLDYKIIKGSGTQTSEIRGSLGLEVDYVEAVVSIQVDPYGYGAYVYEANAFASASW